MRNAILFKSITKAHSDISKKYPHHIKEDKKSTVKQTISKDKKITIFDKISIIVKKFI